MHILSLSPLKMSLKAWSELGCSLHSMHGSPADIAVAMLDSSGTPLFIEEEINELGLWRRRATAPSEASALAAPPPTALQGSKASDTSRHMSKRYTQGKGRMGRMHRQLNVWFKFVELLRLALAKTSKSWKALPPGREDLQILKRLQRFVP